MTVMDVDIGTEAQAMVDRLVDHALDEIAALYAFPAVVYMGDDPLVFRDAACLQRALARYRAILGEMGLARIVSRVVQAPKIIGERFTVVVTNRYLAEDERVIGTSRIRYFVQRMRPCPRIKMVEYEEWPCPDRIAEEGGLLALAA